MDSDVRFPYLVMRELERVIAHLSNTLVKLYRLQYRSLSFTFLGTTRKALKKNLKR